MKIFGKHSVYYSLMRRLEQIKKLIRNLYRLDRKLSAFEFMQNNAYKNSLSEATRAQWELVNFQSIESGIESL